MEVSENGDIANWKIQEKWSKEWRNGFSRFGRKYYCSHDVNKAGESKILKNVRCL
jgi:hypothetical protein